MLGGGCDSRRTADGCDLSPGLFTEGCGQSRSVRLVVFQGGGDGLMVAETMNTVSSTRLPARPLALANLLTYGRIAAVPVVVALMYSYSILDGGLWLRWAALGEFIAAAVTDLLDGY